MWCLHAGCLVHCIRSTGILISVQSMRGNSTCCVETIIVEAGTIAVQPLVLTRQLSWTLLMTCKTLKSLCSSSPALFPRQQSPVFELHSSMEQNQTSIQTMSVTVLGKAGGTLSSESSLQATKQRVFSSLNSVSDFVCKCIFRF